MIKMFSNSKLNIFLLIVGTILMAVGFLFLNEVEMNALNGVCFGVGAGLIGMSVANLFMVKYFKKHPSESKQVEIDYKDERNELIRNKAKAICSDIIQWTIMLVAWITIFADLPVWITLILIGIFVLKSILELYYMNKYNKEF